MVATPGAWPPYKECYVHTCWPGRQYSHQFLKLIVLIICSTYSSSSPAPTNHLPFQQQLIIILTNTNWSHTPPPAIQHHMIVMVPSPHQEVLCGVFS